MNSLANHVLCSLSVLVVDDHDINRDFLRAGLSALVAKVATATDGKSAVDLCRDHCFDVILMDLHMPRMDGLAACQRIRDPKSASRDARIFILTADARPEEHKHLTETGADGYLSKPISIPRLIRAIVEQISPGAASHLQGSSVEDESRLIVPEQAVESANGDLELAARMSRLFAEELGQKLPALDAMIKQGELMSALKLIHQWRGSCGFAGAARLYQACDSLRRSLQDPKRHPPGPSYLDFLRTTHATRQALMAQAPACD